MSPKLRRKFSCGVELTLTVIGGKWKPVILAHLKEQAMRYGELRTRIPALSDKMLTQRLRELQDSGLVQRQKNARGARSVYELTTRGRSLRSALAALNSWGENIAADVGATVEPRW